MNALKLFLNRAAQGGVDPFGKLFAGLGAKRREDQARVLKEAEMANQAEKDRADIRIGTIKADAASRQADASQARASEGAEAGKFSRDPNRVWEGILKGMAPGMVNREADFANTAGQYLPSQQLGPDQLEFLQRQQESNQARLLREKLALARTRGEAAAKVHGDNSTFNLMGDLVQQQQQQKEALRAGLSKILTQEGYNPLVAEEAQRQLEALGPSASVDDLMRMVLQLKLRSKTINPDEVP